MQANRFTAVAAILGLTAVLSLTAAAPTQQPQQNNVAPDNGVEVLARGPIHEAYAEPVDQNRPQPTPVVPKQAPAPLNELPPEEKPAGENVQWIPGYWSWDDDRADFIWVSGFWRVPPPGRQWVPGNWVQVQGGWQWVPGFWNTVAQSQIAYLPPPPEPVEAAPSVPAPRDDSTYVPGCWVYRETQYFWRPGFWVDYRPGWVWIPAHYCWSPCGYLFVEGYWDFDLQRRGLLFSPVSIASRVWSAPNWYYQPRYAVSQDIQPLQMTLQAGLFHDDSLLYKSLHNTLTGDQFAQYDAMARERREFRHRATIELAVATLEQGMPLREAQRRELIDLLTKQTEPPRKPGGPYDYYLVMFQLGRLPEEMLKPLFDNAQWKVLQLLVTRYKQMEPTLRQAGLLSNEDDEAGERARGS